MKEDLKAALLIIGACLALGLGIAAIVAPVLLLLWLFFDRPEATAAAGNVNLAEHGTPAAVILYVILFFIVVEALKDRKK